MTKSVCLMSQICLLLLLCIVLLLYRVFIMELHYDELCVYYSILCAVFVFQCATDISMLCYVLPIHRRLNRRWRDDRRPRTAVLWCYTDCMLRSLCGSSSSALNSAVVTSPCTWRRTGSMAASAVAAPRLRFPNQTRRL